MNKNSGFIRKTLGILTPIISYRIIDLLVVLLGATLLKNSMAEAGWIGEISRNYRGTITVFIKAIALICAGGFILPLFIKETPVIYEKRNSIRRIILCIFLGIGLSIFVNILFSLTGFTGSSEAYEEVSKSQYSFNIVQGIIIYGIISPLTEEILFRGIIYNRLRRDYGLWAGLIFSPLLFGVFHGNLVQTVYGFVLGLFITWIYERYGAFVYPYLVHAFANIAVYTVMQLQLFSEPLVLKEALIISGLLTIFTIYFIGADNADS